MGENSEDEIANFIRRKSAYLEDRKRALGTEYYSAKSFWDRMWDAEWDSLNERMKETEIKDIKMELLPIEFPKLNYEGDFLNLYSFDDFSLLHNQGIFRENKFLIDRRGRWTKKIVAEMKTYGYKHLKTITKEKYLVMEMI
tara:strand:+ start:711 stop:1133 length:423 start_codon:yes stop_codon:yes gene_type:complete